MKRKYVYITIIVLIACIIAAYGVGAIINGVQKSEAEIEERTELEIHGIEADMFSRYAVELSEESKKIVYIVDHKYPITQWQLDTHRLFETAKENKVSDSDLIYKIAEMEIIKDEARDNGINVSFEEGLKRSLEEKALLEEGSSEEYIEPINNYINALGISYDDYWNVFNAEQCQALIMMERLFEIKISEWYETGEINFDRSNPETLKNEYEYFKKHYEEKANKVEFIKVN